MKCDSCKFQEKHSPDSSYPYTELYCSKEHWFGGLHDEPLETDEDPWKDCKDYEKK